MRCGVETEIKSELKDFPEYFNESETKIIFDSNLKGTKLSDSLIYKDINLNIDSLLKVGTYKVILEIEGEQNIQHFTDIAKGILVDNEIKDVYFHKVDIIPENGKTTVTAIFEVITNSLSLIFIVYALGSIGVGITGAFVIKRTNQLVTSISQNVIKIGASVIVILLGIKVISKW